MNCCADAYPVLSDGIPLGVPAVTVVSSSIDLGAFTKLTIDITVPYELIDGMPRYTPPTVDEK